jgi:hypothetical protein
MKNKNSITNMKFKISQKKRGYHKYFTALEKEKK